MKTVSITNPHPVGLSIRQRVLLGIVAVPVLTSSLLTMVPVANADSSTGRRAEPPPSPSLTPPVGADGAKSVAPGDRKAAQSNDHQGGSSAAAAAAAVAPNNNSFAYASTYPSNTSSRAGTTSGATKESAEPAHAGYPGGASVWFRWSSPVSSLITFNTNGSNFDTLLAVYQGTALSNLRTIAFNDDTRSGTLTSAVSFRATGGTAYYIAVDGYGGGSGNYSLNVSWNSGSSRQTHTYNVFRPTYGSQCTAYALDRMYDATRKWMKVAGHAKNWGAEASNSGWQVGAGATSTGAVLVMQPGTYWVYENGQTKQWTANASFGHVAWADSISSGWVHVREQNAYSDGRIGDRWYWVVGAPVQFIYA